MADECIFYGGGSLPLASAALSAKPAVCHAREGGHLLSHPRPNRLSRTPSPKGSHPLKPPIVIPALLSLPQIIRCPSSNGQKGASPCFWGYPIVKRRHTNLS